MTLPPIPPSDNLYKFTAIGGLILVVLSVYVPWKMDADLDTAIVDLTSEQKRIVLEQQHLVLDLQSATERISQKAKYVSEAARDVVSQKRPTSMDLDPVRIKESLATDKNALNEIEQKRRQQELIAGQMEISTLKLRLLFGQEERLRNIMEKSLILGFILSYFGFRNWYFKFQIYQDQIVKAQAAQWTKPPKPETPERDEVPGEI